MIREMLDNGSCVTVVITFLTATRGSYDTPYTPRVLRKLDLFAYGFLGHPTDPPFDVEQKRERGNRAHS